MIRPCSTATTSVAKLSSVMTMSAASLATSVPLMPIATPMSAFRKAGASFTPVAGHGDDLSLALQRLDDSQLVFRRDAGEDGGAGGDSSPARTIQRGKVP